MTIFAEFDIFTLKRMTDFVVYSYEHGIFKAIIIFIIDITMSPLNYWILLNLEYYLLVKHMQMIVVY